MGSNLRVLSRGGTRADMFEQHHLLALWRIDCSEEMWGCGCSVVTWSGDDGLLDLGCCGERRKKRSASGYILKVETLRLLTVSSAVMKERYIFGLRSASRDECIGWSCHVLDVSGLLHISITSSRLTHVVAHVSVFVLFKAA